MSAKIPLLSTLLALCLGLIAWYHFDRSSLLQSACEVGFPNYSRSSEIAPEALRCAILGDKQIYSGILKTGFEASNFTSPDFAVIHNTSGRDDRSAWFHCPKAGCGKDLDNQLNRKYECIGDVTGFASITVEGRPSVSKGKFGHLGMYSREFFATRILKVSPAPDALVQEWIIAFRQRGLCQ
jgi:hypothetical protein